MIRLATLGLVLTLSGCGMLPLPMFNHQATAPAAAPMPVVIPATLAPKERLVAAIAANGCLLTASNVTTILTQAQIAQPDLRALTNELAAEGRAEVSAAGTIRVLTDTCI
jgi:hypothetical protein